MFVINLSGVMLMIIFCY